MSTTTTYTNSRLFFLKTLERMKDDLAQYKTHDAAKSRYIEKQTSIIKILSQYFEAVEELVMVTGEVQKNTDKEIEKRDTIIRRLVLLCDMAHVKGYYMHAALHNQYDIITLDHDAHCSVCNDPGHDFYRNRYEQRPGTICHFNKQDREFYKSLGISYPI